MSTFTLQGRRGDEQIELTWEDGQLSGDRDAVQFVRRLAVQYEGHTISSPADITHTNHLLNSASAASLMRMAFTGQPKCTYSDLEPISPPEGAVM